MQSNSGEIYIIISQNIKYYRKKLKLTQLQLAEISNYSHEYIRRIEAPNTKKYFSIETIYILSKALQVSISKLLERRENEMDNIEKSFFEYASAEFNYYVGRMYYSLQEKDDNYKELKKQLSSELEKYPNVELLLHEKEKVVLSEEEIASLIRILDIEDSIRMLEEKELFFKGGREIYLYLKKMDLLAK